MLQSMLNVEIVWDPMWNGCLELIYFVLSQAWALGCYSIHCILWYQVLTNCVWITKYVNDCILIYVS